MLKKAYFSLVFASALISTTMFSIQLTSIQTATKAALRAYQMQVVILKQIEKTKPQLAPIIPVLEKIIMSASKDFKIAMNTAVEEQYNAIVDQNTPFSATKYEAALTGLIPSASQMNEQVQKIFTILVRREYYQLLWQKLSGKEKELVVEFEKAEKEMSQS